MKRYVCKKNRFLLYLFNSFNPFFIIKHKKNNRICYNSVLMLSIKIKFFGKNNRVIINEGTIIKNSEILVFGNNNTIIISEKCIIKDTKIHIEDDNNQVVIGKETHICGRTELACIEGTKIIIGEKCLFSSEIHFRTGDSHSIINEQGIRINNSQDIVLGNHIWIGRDVTILKGVVIPDNCVIGATSTLTKKFIMENSCIAGVPAKVIKNGINWINTRI